MLFWWRWWRTSGVSAVCTHRSRSPASRPDDAPWTSSSPSTSTPIESRVVGRREGSRGSRGRGANAQPHSNTHAKTKTGGREVAQGEGARIPAGMEGEQGGGRSGRRRTGDSSAGAGGGGDGGDAQEKQGGCLPHLRSHETSRTASVNSAGSRSAGGVSAVTRVARSGSG